MAVTTNLSITKLEVGQAQKEATINTALDTLDALFGAGSSAWASWTPTWTNLTVGNGTVTAKYAKIGKFVAARLSIVFGSSTSVSGLIGVSLPVNIATYGGTIVQQIGVVRMFDSSAVLGVEGWIGRGSSSRADVFASSAGGTYVGSSATSSTVPFTWATSDELITQFIYEAA